ncbi:elongation factor P [Candidatus Microgenomates bacterium]|nr:elongation factor P [Candidatus Microgenomates bacterium]
MINVTDLRSGVTFLLNGAPYVVLKYSHNKIGRGSANVRIEMRNLRTGSVEERTFMSSARVYAALTVKRPMQYLYNDEASAVFMNPITFEQVEITKSIVGTELKFLQEGKIVDVLFWGEQALSILLPPKLKFRVTQADPGAKGNSATNVWKQIVLENGMQVKAPLFIKPGDSIVVDTRTGEYVERSK